MTVALDAETRDLVGRLRRRHDHFVNVLYQQRRRQGADIYEIARDPETVYHIDAAESLAEYMED